MQNPQTLNSYSYANGNPIINKDPNGRVAIGVGLGGSGNSPGLYGGGSVYAVLTLSINPLNIEFGIVGSGQGGGTTALGGANATAGILFSNARNISELEGPEVNMGGSVRWLGDAGLDIGVSKSDNPNRKIITINPSGGLGGVATPYVLPAEVHGGLGYTTTLYKVNLTQTFTNAAKTTMAVVQSAPSALQSQLNNIQRQIQEIQKQVQQIQQKIYQLSNQQKRF